MILGAALVPHDMLRLPQAKNEGVEGGPHCTKLNPTVLNNKHLDKCNYPLLLLD